VNPRPFVRHFLRAVAALLMLFGAIYVWDPSRMAGDVGILFDAVGATDVRATYGGIQIGFALFLLWAARRPERQHTALVATALILGCVAATRVLGPLLGDGWAPFHTFALVFEITVTSLSVWLARPSAPA
jgi:hypothetical protein